MSKIVTKLPEDVYGEDKWALIVNDDDAWIITPQNLPHLNEAAFVHWSILTDEERDKIRFEWIMEEPENETL